MRPYMNNEYLKNLIGGIFKTNESTLQKYNGLKVSEIIKELTEQEYDRELIDDTDKNEKGEYRYLINTMYKIKLENNEIITVFEDEINPNYHGSWIDIEKSNRMYELLKNHIGHNIVCVAYGDINNPDDICIECEDCNEVLISAKTFEDED